jgi:hypothetical protein
MPGISAEFERARLGDVGEGAADEGLGLGADRSSAPPARRRSPATRCGRCGPHARAGCRCGRRAHEHAIRDLAPARDLLLRVDAGRVLVALALLRDLARFGDQQAGRGALAVVLHRKRIRHQAGRHRAVARQRRHDERGSKASRAPSLKGSKSLVGWLMGKCSGCDGCRRLVHCRGQRNGLSMRGLQASCARFRPCGRHRGTGCARSRRRIHSKSGTARHRRPPSRCPGGRKAPSGRDPIAGGWHRGPSACP